MFCTYVTFYSGNKLPPFYLGSTSVMSIEKGYHGSVASKEYRDVWLAELKANPQLFRTVILRTYSTRAAAFERESLLQQKMNVVSSPFYINKAIAKPGGWFGAGLFGERNPHYGKHLSEAHREKLSISGRKPKTESTKTKMQIAQRKRREIPESPRIYNFPVDVNIPNITVRLLTLGEVTERFGMHKNEVHRLFTSGKPFKKGKFKGWSITRAC